MKENRRLFFGFDIETLWPQDLPKGKLIEEKERHMTYVFLGNQDVDFLKENILLPEFQVAPVGKFEKCVLLNSNVVAWEIDWITKKEEIANYRNQLINSLQKKNIDVADSRPFYPHVTVAREGNEFALWEKAFTKLPLILRSFHLYESLGNSKYESLWEHNFLMPIEEIEHTADIAFRIRGQNYQEIHLHAELALAFEFPRILPFIEKPKENETLDDIIMDLNHLVTRADSELGCPFKAISFHGDLKENNGHFLWEMIIDV